MLLFSFLQEISNSPNITDWLQGIGTIVGVPGAIAAFILLFKKDKDKEKQLNILTNMVAELSNQTKQFEYQTSLIRESNEILKEQVEIQNEALMSDKDYKEKMKEIEIKKTKAQYRPYFKSDGSIGQGQNFEVRIKNWGEKTKITLLKQSEENGTINLPKTPFIVDKNEVISLSGRYSDPENIFKQHSTLKVYFEDSIGTKYTQEFIINDRSLKILDAIEDSE